ncbi:HupE/UreJ family protein [Methylobacter psychrophilus]|uniref:HupE/UreJ family protein n=1 Tax=Methylobacter psychrophilus TaxID=96941 RepID=UPI0021D4A291|nr:HupE/UreJ family protein [Methylobacter psychrophilus]
MNAPINNLILFALHNRQRIMLAVGLLVVLVIVLINSLRVAVDIGGWSSGFTHPLHGGDHLLTMLAVGIWAAQLRGQAIWMLPLTFVGVMSLGGLAGAAGLLIPGAEVIILFSCLVFTVLITRKIRFSSQTNLVIVAFFAFFHGFAHGQEISTSVSLISYTLGFMVATLLLHGAGILAVRLMVLLFAFFLSHLAYAQSATNSSTAKSTVPTQTDKSHELTLAIDSAPSNSSHNRQRLYNDDNGAIHAEIEQYHLQNYSLIREREPACASDKTGKLSADKLATTGLPSNHQPGIDFLTSGVGATSPPTLLVVNNTSRFCPAAVFLPPTPDNNSGSSLKTSCYFDLLHAFYTLATSFLTNGVGATSPPDLQASVVVTLPDLNELAFGNSHLFKSFTPLNFAISRTLFPGNSPVTQTSLNSHLSILTLALLLPIDRHYWSLRSISHLNITNNNNFR